MGNENIRTNGFSISNPYSLGFGIYNKYATLQIFSFDDHGSAEIKEGAFSSSTYLIQVVGK
jgi:hypothetical protein